MHLGENSLEIIRDNKVMRKDSRDHLSAIKLALLLQEDRGMAECQHMGKCLAGEVKDKDLLSK